MISGYVFVILLIKQFSTQYVGCLCHILDKQEFLFEK